MCIVCTEENPIDYRTIPIRVILEFMAMEKETVKDKIVERRWYRQDDTYSCAVIIEYDDDGYISDDVLVFPFKA